MEDVVVICVYEAQAARDRLPALVVGGAAVGAVVATATNRGRRAASPKRGENNVAEINYEFGDTSESRAFWKRNAEFEPLFDRLITLTNKCFGREYQPANYAEGVVFDLGQACRDDFGEVVFLAVHGHGNGATKILRGMFERAVTTAYLIKHPAKAERFVRYAAIQEHRAMAAALKVLSKKEFDEAMGAGNTVAEIRKRYQEVKPEFETTVCSACGTTRTAGSWDPLDIASMVHHVGGPFQHFYLGAYFIPLLQSHATLASTARDKSPRDEADFAFRLAFGLMFTVIRYQNLMYKLNMDEDLAAFAKVLGAEWMTL
jgi:hypothetical protein